MLMIQNFIGGSFINPVENQWLDLVNPATNEVFGNIPASQEGDVLLAVEAVTKSQIAWQNCSSNERFLILNRIADGIEEHLEEYGYINLSIITYYEIFNGLLYKDAKKQLSKSLK